MHLNKRSYHKTLSIWWFHSKRTVKKWTNQAANHCGSEYDLQRQKSLNKPKTKPRVKDCSANTGFGCKSRNWDLRIHLLWSSTLLRLNKKAPCVNSAKIQVLPKHFSNHVLQLFLKMPKTVQTWFYIRSSSHSSINHVTLPSTHHVTYFY